MLCISGFLLIDIWIYGNNIIVLTIEVFEKTIRHWLWGLYWRRGIFWENIYLFRKLSPCLISPGALPWLKHHFMVHTFLISCSNRKKYKLYIFIWYILNYILTCKSYTWDISNEKWFISEMKYILFVSFKNNICRI